MSDILCAVCGEPWDAYGVHHGDMLAWEATLFKAGAGCPSCAGVAPDGIDADDVSLRSAESMASWDDPHSFPHYNDAIGGTERKRPAWEEPPRRVLWTCAGCGASAVEPLRFSLCEPNDAADNGPEWDDKGERVHYAHGLAYRRGGPLDRHDPDDGPAHMIAGQPYCDACATSCDGDSDECSGSIFARSDLQGDAYDAGASFPSSQSWGQSLCLQCFEHEEREVEEHARQEELATLRNRLEEAIDEAGPQFMGPELWEGSFLELDTAAGTEVLPLDHDASTVAVVAAVDAGDDALAQELAAPIVGSMFPVYGVAVRRDVWAFRFSAPGYLDATDTVLFDDERDALQHAIEQVEELVEFE